MIALLAAAQLAAAPCALTPVEDRELRDLKTRRWPAIYAAPDPAALAALLHPSFQVIDGAGAVSTREDELAYLRSKAPDPPERRFTYRIERLEVFPNCTAVIAGEGRIVTTAPGRPPAVATYRSSNVLIKEDGVWRAILSHVSGDREATP